MKRTIAIIGYGVIGAWHAQNITKRIPNLEVSHIYDINEEKRKKAVLDGFDCCATVEEFWKRSADFVLVATPNNFHKEYCVEALSRGFNVVCEKPVCLDMQQLQEILDCAKRNGKIFTVHFNRRWDYDYKIVEKVLQQGTIGKPYSIYSRLYSNRSIPCDWRTCKEAGGGYLFDWGVHLIDQALTLKKEMPCSVYAELKHIYQTEVDDSIRISLRWKDGLTIFLVADSWTFINEARWHLSGSDGTAIVEKWNGQDGKIIKANVREVDWTQGCVYTHNGLSRTMYPRPKKEIEELPLPKIEDPNWEDFYNNLLDCLDGKAEPLITQQQIQNVQTVLMACFESAKKNEVVKL